MTLQSISPPTGEVIKTYEAMSAAAVTRAIEQSNKAFLGWRTTDLSARATCKRRAAQCLRD